MVPARFDREQLIAFNGGTVDDLIGPGPRLLFVGINPSLWTAAVNAHFARRGNRFWPALYEAGLVPRRVDASDGMKASDVLMVHEAGIGITNLVPTASAKADELTKQQLLDGGRRLAVLVAGLQPLVVAVLGLTAYRHAFDRRTAVAGRQAERIGETEEFPGSELWVLPNPSGLNAHETVSSLASVYRQAGEAAGVVNCRAESV